MATSEHRRLQANLWRYQVFCLVFFTPFMLPVIVLFWRENGLDLIDVHLLQAIFAVAVVALEVPTGMVADRLGKRTSLIAASATMAIGMVVYAIGRGFGVFLAGELALAFGLSLFSGAGSALLYDSLAALDRAEEFQRYEGRTRALQLTAVALCSLVGGLVGARSYRATVWLTAIGPAFALFWALGLTDVRSAPGRGQPWRESLWGYGSLIASSLRFVGKHRLVRWQILFLGVLSASSFWLLWVYQPYMEQSGLRVWAFGAAFALFNLFAALASHLADRVGHACGRTGTLWLLAALQVAPPLLMAWQVHPLSFLFILGHQATRGLAPPIISARILRYTYADKRATVLSIGSMTGRLLYGMTAVLFGWIAEHLSLGHGLYSQGAATAALLLALLISYARIPPKYFSVKPTVRDHQ